MAAARLAARSPAWLFQALWDAAAAAGQQPGQDTRCSPSPTDAAAAAAAATATPTGAAAPRLGVLPTVLFSGGVPLRWLDCDGSNQTLRAVAFEAPLGGGGGEGRHDGSGGVTEVALAQCVRARLAQLLRRFRGFARVSLPAPPAGEEDAPAAVLVAYREGRVEPALPEADFQALCEHAEWRDAVAFVQPALPTGGGVTIGLHVRGWDAATLQPAQAADAVGAELAPALSDVLRSAAASAAGGAGGEPPPPGRLRSEEANSRAGELAGCVERWVPCTGVPCVAAVYCRAVSGAALLALPLLVLASEGGAGGGGAQRTAGGSASPTRAPRSRSQRPAFLRARDAPPPARPPGELPPSQARALAVAEAEAAACGVHAELQRLVNAALGAGLPLVEVWSHFATDGRDVLDEHAFRARLDQLGLRMHDLAFAALLARVQAAPEVDERAAAVAATARLQPSLVKRFGPAEFVAFLRRDASRQFPAGAAAVGGGAPLAGAASADAYADAEAACRSLASRLTTAVAQAQASSAAYGGDGRSTRTGGASSQQQRLQPPPAEAWAGAAAGSLTRVSVPRHLYDPSSPLADLASSAGAGGGGSGVLADRARSDSFHLFASMAAVGGAGAPLLPVDARPAVTGALQLLTAAAAGRTHAPLRTSSSEASPGVPQLVSVYAAARPGVAAAAAASATSARALAERQQKQERRRRGSSRARVVPPSGSPAHSPASPRHATQGSTTPGAAAYLSQSSASARLSSNLPRDAPLAPLSALRAPLELRRSGVGGWKGSAPPRRASHGGVGGSAAHSTPFLRDGSGGGSSGAHDSRGDASTVRGSSPEEADAAEGSAGLWGTPALLRSAGSGDDGYPLGSPSTASAYTPSPGYFGGGGELLVDAAGFSSPPAPAQTAADPHERGSGQPSAMRDTGGGTVHGLAGSTCSPYVTRVDGRVRGGLFDPEVIRRLGVPQVDADALADAAAGIGVEGRHARSSTHHGFRIPLNSAGGTVVYAVVESPVPHAGGGDDAAEGRRHVVHALAKRGLPTHGSELQQLERLEAALEDETAASRAAQLRCGSAEPRSRRASSGSAGPAPPIAPAEGPSPLSTWVASGIPLEPAVTAGHDSPAAHQLVQVTHGGVPPPDPTLEPAATALLQMARQRAADVRHDLRASIDGGGTHAGYDELRALQEEARRDAASQFAARRVAATAAAMDVVPYSAAALAAALVDGRVDCTEAGMQARTMCAAASSLRARRGEAERAFVRAAAALRRLQVDAVRHRVQLGVLGSALAAASGEVAVLQAALAGAGGDADAGQRLPAALAETAELTSQREEQAALATALTDDVSLHMIGAAGHAAAYAHVVRCSDAAEAALREGREALATAITRAHDAAQRARDAHEAHGFDAAGLTTFLAAARSRLAQLLDERRRLRHVTAQYVDTAVWSRAAGDAVQPASGTSSESAADPPPLQRVETDSLRAWVGDAVLRQKVELADAQAALDVAGEEAARAQAAYAAASDATSTLASALRAVVEAVRTAPPATGVSVESMLSRLFAPSGAVAHAQRGGMAAAAVASAGGHIPAPASDALIADVFAGVLPAEALAGHTGGEEADATDAYAPAAGGLQGGDASSAVTRGRASLAWRARELERGVEREGCLALMAQSLDERALRDVGLVFEPAAPAQGWYVAAAASALSLAPVVPAHPPPGAPLGYASPTTMSAGVHAAVGVPAEPLASAFPFSHAPPPPGTAHGKHGWQAPPASAGYDAGAAAAETEVVPWRAPPLRGGGGNVLATQHAWLVPVVTAGRPGRTRMPSARSVRAATSGSVRRPGTVAWALALRGSEEAGGIGANGALALRGASRVNAGGRLLLSGGDGSFVGRDGAVLRVAAECKPGAVVRWMPSARRSAEQREWLAMDRRLHPKRYARLSGEEAGALETHPSYRCAMPRDALARIAALPASPLQALPYLRNAAEARAHALLMHYSHGAGESAERLRDQESGARATAMAAVARGYIARVKPPAARTPEEADWVALDVLVRPHLYAAAALLAPPPAPPGDGEACAAPYEAPPDSRGSLMTPPPTADWQGSGEQPVLGAAAFTDTDDPHDLSLAGTRRAMGGFGGYVRRTFAKLLAYDRRATQREAAATAAREAARRGGGAPSRPASSGRPRSSGSREGARRDQQRASSRSRSRDGARGATLPPSDAQRTASCATSGIHAIAELQRGCLPARSPPGSLASGFTRDELLGVMATRPVDLPSAAHSRAQLLLQAYGSDGGEALYRASLARATPIVGGLDELTEALTRAREEREAAGALDYGRELAAAYPGGDTSNVAAAAVQAVQASVLVRARHAQQVLSVCDAPLRPGLTADHCFVVPGLLARAGAAAPGAPPAGAFRFDAGIADAAAAGAAVDVGALARVYAASSAPPELVTPAEVETGSPGAVACAVDMTVTIVFRGALLDASYVLGRLSCEVYREPPAPDGQPPLHAAPASDGAASAAAAVGAGAPGVPPVRPSQAVRYALLRPNDVDLRELELDVAVHGDTAPITQRQDGTGFEWMGEADEAACRAARASGWGGYSSDPEEYASCSRAEAVRAGSGDAGVEADGCGRARGTLRRNLRFKRRSRVVTAGVMPALDQRMALQREPGWYVQDAQRELAARGAGTAYAPTASDATGAGGGGAPSPQLAAFFERDPTTPGGAPRSAMRGARRRRASSAAPPSVGAAAFRLSTAATAETAALPNGVLWRAPSAGLPSRGWLGTAATAPRRPGTVTFGHTGALLPRLQSALPPGTARTASAGGGGALGQAVGGAPAQSLPQAWQPPTHLLLGIPQDQVIASCRVPVGYAVASECVPNTAHGLGRLVVRHEPLTAPVQPGRYCVSVTGLSPGSYSISVTCGLAYPAHDVIDGAARAAATIELDIAAARADLGEMVTAERLGARKLALVEGMIADSEAQVAALGARMAALHTALAQGSVLRADLGGDVNADSAAADSGGAVSDGEEPSLGGGGVGAAPATPVDVDAAQVLAARRLRERVPVDAEVERVIGQRLAALDGSLLHAVRALHSRTRERTDVAEGLQQLASVRNDRAGELERLLARSREVARSLPGIVDALRVCDPTAPLAPPSSAPDGSTAAQPLPPNSAGYEHLHMTREPTRQSPAAEATSAAGATSPPHRAPGIAATYARMPRHGARGGSSGNSTRAAGAWTNGARAAPLPRFTPPLVSPAVADYVQWGPHVVMWTLRRAVARALQAAPTPAATLRRKPRSTLTAEERVWASYDRLLHPEHYDGRGDEQDAEADVERLLGECGRGAPNGAAGGAAAGAVVPSTDARLDALVPRADYSRPELLRILALPLVQLTSSEARVRSLLLRFHDDPRHEPPPTRAAAEGGAGRPATGSTSSVVRGEPTAEAAVLLRRARHFTQEGAFHAGGSPFAMARTALPLPAPAVAGAADASPPALLRELQQRRADRMEAGWRSARRDPRANPDATLVTGARSVTEDVDARCRELLAELDRACRSERPLLDSNLLHGREQRFPGGTLAGALEAELDRVLVAQVAEREAAEAGILAARDVSDATAAAARASEAAERVRGRREAAAQRLALREAELRLKWEASTVQEGRARVLPTAGELARRTAREQSAAALQAVVARRGSAVMPSASATAGASPADGQESSLPYHPRDPLLELGALALWGEDGKPPSPGRGAAATADATARDMRERRAAREGSAGKKAASDPPHGCRACGTPRCMWRPPVDERAVRQRLTVVEAELLRVRTLPPPPPPPAPEAVAPARPLVESTVALSTLRGGPHVHEASELVFELAYESARLADALRLAALDRDLHAVTASLSGAGDTVVITALSGHPQTMWRPNALAALRAALRPLTARAAAEAVVNGLLDHMLAGWHFGEVVPRSGDTAGYVSREASERPWAERPAARARAADAARGLQPLARLATPPSGEADGAHAYLSRLLPATLLAPPRAAGGGTQGQLQPHSASLAPLHAAQLQRALGDALEAQAGLDRALRLRPGEQQDSPPSAPPPSTALVPFHHAGLSPPAPPPAPLPRIPREAHWAAITAVAGARAVLVDAQATSAGVAAGLDDAERAMQAGVFVAALHFFRLVNQMAELRELVAGRGGGVSTGGGGASMPGGSANATPAATDRGVQEACAAERARMNAAEAARVARQAAAAAANARALRGWAAKAGRLAAATAASRGAEAARARRRGRERAAATTVQRVWRGWRTRSRLAAYLAAQRAGASLEARREAGAVALQALWRGHVARQFSADVRGELEAFLRSVRREEADELVEAYHVANPGTSMMDGLRDGLAARKRAAAVARVARRRLLVDSDIRSALGPALLAEVAHARERAARRASDTGSSVVGELPHAELERALAAEDAASWRRRRQGRVPAGVAGGRRGEASTAPPTLPAVLRERARTLVFGTRLLVRDAVDDADGGALAGGGVVDLDALGDDDAYFGGHPLTAMPEAGGRRREDSAARFPALAGGGVASAPPSRRGLDAGDTPVRAAAPAPTDASRLPRLVGPGGGGGGGGGGLRR